MKRFGIFALGLTLAFSWPLADLIRFCVDSSLYSHVLLMPAVVVYLARLKLKELRPTFHRSPAQAAGFGAAALMVLLAYGGLRLRGAEFLPEDYLFLTVLPFALLLVAGGFLFLGAPCLRTLSFPAAMLVFVVPFPTVVTHGVEMFFQYTSAEVSYRLLTLTNTPMFREGLIFQLPGIVLEVAQECSGIRSSLVLFITSLIASHMFLTSPWKRFALAVFVIPLAIARNATRIVTIALLCVHVDPAMIDSIIHRRGGPLFFAMSLVPFFILLLLLKRSEPKPEDASRAAHPDPTIQKFNDSTIQRLTPSN